VEFDGAMPPATPGFAITNEFWKLPKNWKEVAGHIHWAAEDQIPLLIDGPEFLVANCTSQLKDRRILIHLVNYDVTKTPTIPGVQVSAVLPDKHTAIKVTALAPGSQSAKQVEFTRQSGRTIFTVPEVQTYALVTIEW
jgi:hypothetical protein